MNRLIAQKIAIEWIEAWNCHDLERILLHYTDNFEMSSPFIGKFYPESKGTLVGKNNIRTYWKMALEKYPNLHFELEDVFFCVSSICIVYNSSITSRTVEWLNFDNFNEDGHFMVNKASGNYQQLPF